MKNEIYPKASFYVSSKTSVWLFLDCVKLWRTSCHPNYGAEFGQVSPWNPPIIIHSGHFFLALLRRLRFFLSNDKKKGLKMIGWKRREESQVVKIRHQGTWKQIIASFAEKKLFCKNYNFYFSSRNKDF